MKKYVLIIFIATLISGIAQSASAASKLVRDMVALDKVYIAALLSVSEDDRASAKKIMKQLETQWHIFKKNHQRDFPEDRSARVDLAEIDQMIEDAARITRLNGKLADVREIMVGVRIAFIHLRQRNSIDYYLDHLAKFQESMESMVFIAKGKTPETLTDANIRTMKLLLTESIRDWQEAINAPFDSELFAFTTEMKAKQKEYLSQEAEALDRLRMALDNEDKALVILEPLAVKSNFAKLLALFGNWQGTR